MWTVTEKPKYREYREMRRGRSCWVPATVFLLALMLYALWIQNGQAAKIAQAESDGEILAQKLQTSANEVKSLREKLFNAEKTKEDLANQIRDLNSQLESKSKQIHNVETEKNTIQEESDTYRQQMEEAQTLAQVLKQRNENEQTSLFEKDQEIKKLKEQISNLNSEKSSLQEQDQTKSNDLVVLNEELNKLKEELTQLKTLEPEGDNEPDALYQGLDPAQNNSDNTNEDTEPILTPPKESELSNEQVEDGEENEVDSPSIEETIDEEDGGGLYDNGEGTNEELDTDDIDYKQEDTVLYDNTADDQNIEAYSNENI